MTFSSAVISGNSRMFWNVRAMPIRVISCFLRPVTDSPAEPDLAAGRPVDAGHRVEAGRLAGAVRPDQPEDLALAQREADLVEGDARRRTAASRCRPRAVRLGSAASVGPDGRRWLVWPPPADRSRSLGVRASSLVRDSTCGSRHCGATSFARSFSSIARRRLGIRPCGRKIMISMITTPKSRNRYCERSVQARGSRIPRSRSGM